MDQLQREIEDLAHLIVQNNIEHVYVGESHDEPVVKEVIASLLEAIAGIKGKDNVGLFAEGLPYTWRHGEEYPLNIVTMHDYEGYRQLFDAALRMCDLHGINDTKIHYYKENSPEQMDIWEREIIKHDYAIKLIQCGEWHACYNQDDTNMSIIKRFPDKRSLVLALVYTESPSIPATSIRTCRETIEADPFYSRPENGHFADYCLCVPLGNI